MAEVKHFIDQQSIQGDADLIKGILDDVLIKLEKIKKVKIDLSGLKSFGSAGDAAKQLERTLNELNRAQEKLATTNAKLAKSAQALANQKNAESKLRQQEARELDAIEKSKQKILAQQDRELKQLEKNNNAYTQLIEKQKLAGAASLKRGAELLKEANGNEQMFLSLLKTDKAYLDSSKSAKNLNDQLLLLEQNIGRNQRNVGNYASAYNGLQRQFGLIANELPSLTISVQQFALALSNNLPMAAEEIRNTQKEIKQLQAEGKPAPSLFSKLTSAVFSFQVGISIVVTLLVAFSGQIVELIKGLTGSTTALDRATASINKFASDAQASASNLRGFNTELDNFITLLTERNSLLAGGDLDTLRAELQISFQKEAAAVKTATNAYGNYEKILGEISKISVGPDFFGTIVDKSADVPEQLKNQEKETLEIYQDATKQVADEKFKQQLLILRINNQKTKDEEDFKNKIKDLQDKRLKELQDNARREEEARRASILASLQDYVDYQKEISEDEENGYEERAKALENYFSVEEVIIKNNRDFQLADLKKKQQELLLSDAQVKQQRALIELNFLLGITKVNREQQDALLKLEIEYADKREALRLRLLKRQLEAIDNSFEIRKAQLERQRDEELNILFEQANATDMPIEEQKMKELEIVTKYNRLILQAELDKIEQLIRAEPDPVRREQLLARAAAIQIELNKLVTDEQLKNIDLIAKKEQELAELRRRLQDELLNLAKSAALGRFDSEKNAIQDNIELLEEKKRKEIEFINATVTNEIEKAARITNAEKKAQVERERLQLRQRQLDQQRAKFERAFNIAQIAINTIREVGKIKLAVAGHIATGNLAAAALAGSQIPLAIAIGAVQAAAILATPIPRFRTGKGQYDQYEGPAWVGDGGKSEMIFREDGGIERTPSTPVMTWVGKNDIIHPDADALINRVVKSQSKDTAFTSTYSNFDKVGDALSIKLDKVAYEIRNKREWQVNISNEGATVKTKDGNRTKEYLNRNLQFGK